MKKQTLTYWCKCYHMFVIRISALTLDANAGVGVEWKKLV